MGVKCLVYLVLGLHLTISKKKWILIYTNFFKQKNKSFLLSLSKKNTPIFFFTQHHLT